MGRDLGVHRPRGSARARGSGSLDGDRAGTPAHLRLNRRRLFFDDRAAPDSHRLAAAFKQEIAMSRQLFDLTGRVALVTGGSKGLGRDDVRRLADRAIAEMGRVDILVNNAGSNNPQPIDAIRDEDWDQLVELNLNSCMALTRALVGPMKERRWGRIIHISSIMAYTSAPGRNAYSATKSALTGLARASANDLGDYGITVNCLAPGPFLTDLPASLLSEEQRAAFARRTVLGRWGRPEELVGPALLLASEAGSYITGTTLIVDGGALIRAF
jgi:NAD(P)-dependent dehydrogenase (short-subunit alcohol dehydrogenase family)